MGEHGGGRTDLVVPPPRLNTSVCALPSRAKGKVVCTALARSTRAERLEHDVHDALRGQDIATADGRGARGCEEAPARNAD